MKGKRLRLTAVSILALAAFLLAGCAGGEVSLPGGASSATSLTKATMCRSVNPDTGEPVEPTSSFAPDTAEIFCSAKLANAPAGSEIKSEWIFVRGETGEEVDYLIDTWNTTATGSGYVSFSITAPESNWPKGDYQVVLYLDGKEVTSASFKVQ
ncbi:MAG: hypothetical protein JW790_05505 [Dehalococcoidales bacterium]|nr:hypothetical protein [Dehalococcoidales bacterium]